MKFKIQFFSVFVTCKSIKTYYVGGLSQLFKDAYKPLNMDDNIVTFYFMDSKELDKFCGGLIEQGLRFNENKFYSPDFVVVENIKGMSWFAEWLKVEDGYAIWVG